MLPTVRFCLISDAMIEDPVNERQFQNFMQHRFPLGSMARRQEAPDGPL
jgi:hypothetical protein